MTSPLSLFIIWNHTNIDVLIPRQAKDDGLWRFIALHTSAFLLPERRPKHHKSSWICLLNRVLLIVVDVVFLSSTQSVQFSQPRTELATQNFTYSTKAASFLPVVASLLRSSYFFLSRVARGRHRSRQVVFRAVDFKGLQLRASWFPVTWHKNPSLSWMRLTSGVTLRPLFMWTQISFWGQSFCM